VLRAFSWYSPGIGYCQGTSARGSPCRPSPLTHRGGTGLNFIAGALLLVCTDEEAFWLLATLVDRILPQDYYTETMAGACTHSAQGGRTGPEQAGAGAHTDQLHFADLVRDKLPDVAAHVRRQHGSRERVGVS
jgi:hypothetical protein